MKMPVIRTSRAGSRNIEYWFKDNKLHRYDGPASIVYGQLEISKIFYIDGKVTPELEQWLVDNHLIGKDWDDWTDEQQVLCRG